MYYTQCLEHQLGLDLASMHNDEFLDTPPQDRNVFFERQNRKTLGRMKSDLITQGCLPATLKSRLSKAVKFRNWLAHHYFQERASEILTTEGREQMIFELQEKADFFQELDKDFTEILVNWLLSQGISKEDIELEMATICRKRTDNNS